MRRLTTRAQGEGSGTSASLADQPEQRARDEMLRRLQFGIGGVATMFLLVGLANMIDRRANLAEAAAMPAAAASIEPEQTVVEDDPLVSAGVVPDLPAEPTPAPATTAQPLAPGSDGAAEP